MGDSGQIYDGFISYSHAADDLLAPRLQSALQRFAKPWWKRRAVRIFRDESSLSANPHLWSSITEALDASGWFVLLLSPDAAQSEWVNQEIAYWVEHRDSSRILPVVTDGSFGWDSGDVSGDAVPGALRGVFEEEPRWVDVRWAKDEDQLDLQDPRFADAAADIASTIRGIPKDDLASEEVRQHRRTVRTAWAAGGLVTVHAIAAAGFGIQASRNADEAERFAQAESAARAEAQDLADAEASARAAAEESARRETEARAVADLNAQLARSRELAASAVAVLDEDPGLARLLTLEAIASSPEGSEQLEEVISTLWKAVQSDRLVGVIQVGGEGAVDVALSPDGELLVAGTEDGAIRAFRMPVAELLWESLIDGVVDTDRVFVSPDGSRVAVGVWAGGGAPSELVVFEAESGVQIARLSFGDCDTAVPAGWSPDGSYFAVLAGPAPCVRSGSVSTTWIEVLEGTTFESVSLIEWPFQDELIAAFDESNALYVFSLVGEPLSVLEPPSFGSRRVIDTVFGFGDVSIDGELIATFDQRAAGFVAFDRFGSQFDAIGPIPAFPSFPFGLNFSGPPGRLTITSEGETTTVVDVPSGRILFSLPTGPAWSSVITADGSRLYVGLLDGTVSMWDLSPAVGLDSAGDIGEFDWINSNNISVGAALGDFGAIDFEAFVNGTFFFDPATGEIVSGPLDVAEAYALADGRFLVYRSVQWSILDPVTGDEVVIAGCEADEPGGTCVATGEPAPEFFEVFVSVDGTRLASYPEVGRAATGVEDTPPFTIIDPLDGSVIDEFVPQNRFFWITTFSEEWIAGADSRSEFGFVVEDRRTGETLAEFRWGVGAQEVSESGQLIAIWDGELVHLVDTTTWSDRVFPIELGRVRGISINEELGVLALGDENGLHLYDMQTTSRIKSIPVEGVSDIHWLEDDLVVVGTSTGIWVRVPLDDAGLIRSARETASRTFTSGECATYRFDPCPTLDEIRSR